MFVYGFVFGVGEVFVCDCDYWCGFEGEWIVGDVDWFGLCVVVILN